LFERFDHELSEIAGVSIPGELLGGVHGVLSDCTPPGSIRYEEPDGAREFLGIFLIFQKDGVVQVLKPSADACARADDYGKSARHSFENGQIEGVLEGGS
jgi:hypothetical protein